MGNPWENHQSLAVEEAVLLKKSTIHGGWIRLDWILLISTWRVAMYCYVSI
jgi:hypothetical protein